MAHVLRTLGPRLAQLVQRYCTMTGSKSSSVEWRPSPSFLTFAEAANELRVSVSVIAAWCDQGLEYVRPGKTRLVPREALNQWVMEHARRTGAPACANVIAAMRREAASRDTLAAMPAVLASLKPGELYSMREIVRRTPSVGGRRCIERAVRAMLDDGRMVQREGQYGAPQTCAVPEPDACATREPDAHTAPASRYGAIVRFPVTPDGDNVA